MKRAAIGVAALVTFLASGRAAEAAGTIRVDLFPDQPRVGQVATLQLRTFWTLLNGSRPPAVFPEGYSWTIAALSPKGRRLPIRVDREPPNPSQWSGKLRFPSPGAWTLCVFNFQSHTDAKTCSTRNPMRLRVQVRATDARDSVWQRLQRPFHIPTIAEASRCPTTSPDPRGGLGRIGFAGTAWGAGPAYPGGLDSGVGKPVLQYLDPIPRESLIFGSSWFGNKVLWMIDPVYRGPVLIRGRQLDGPNELRFDRGLVPPREIRISTSPAPRGRPSFTRVRAPGCYGYQVDGLGFSYTIVFEARPS